MGKRKSLKRRLANQARIAARAEYWAWHRQQFDEVLAESELAIMESVLQFVKESELHEMQR